MRDTFYCLQHSWFLPLLTEYLLWLVGRFPVLCFPPSLPCFSLAISVAEWHISSQWNPSQSWLRGSGEDEPIIWASIALSEKVMATHSSTLAWRIPWMVEPGGLPSIGSLRVGQDWSDLAAAAAIALYIKWGLTTATSWGEDHTTDLEGSRWPWESKWC